MPQKRLQHPQHRVVGVVEDPDRVDTIVAALQDEGVESARIDVLTSEDTHEAIDPTGRSWAGRVREVVSQALGDEMAHLQSLQDALDRGAYVVQVQTPTAEGPELDRAKQAFTDLLRRHGATQVAYFGRWETEER